MRPKTFRHGAGWRPVVVLTLALSLCLMSQSPASAQDLSQNFQFSYEPVTFDKSEIHGSEVFHVTIAGRITCTQALPISASEALLNSQVVAKPAASGTEVTLNSSYTITIKPFPSKKGETAEINQAVPLQFPAQAESGDYNIVGKIVEAKVKVGFAWVNVTGYLPQEQPMGMVKYTAPESTATPPPSSPSAQPPPAPTQTQSAPQPKPSPTPAPAPATTPTTTATTLTWWVWLIITVAVATTAFNIIWFLRHRPK
jgi:hypothetical protein